MNVLFCLATEVRSPQIKELAGLVEAIDDSFLLLPDVERTPSFLDQWPLFWI